MASPSRNSLAVIDPVLSNFSLEYTQEKLVTMSGSGFGLTSDFIFPRVPHRGEGLTGRYFTYDIGNRFTLPAAALVRRASNTDYHKIDWDVGSATYLIEDYGLGKMWDDNEVSAQLRPVDLNRDSVEIATDLTLLDYSRRINAIVTNSSTITQTATAANLNGQWSAAGSNPIGDVNTAVNTIYQATGVRPNRMVVGWNVWINGIMNNDEIISRIQAAQNMAGNADITPRLVGERLFNLDMRVDTGIINTAVEGQTASLSTSGTNMFGLNALIFFAAKTPTVKSRALGFSVHKSDEWFRVRRWDTAPKSHNIAVSQMVAEELVAHQFGYLITSVTAS